VNNGPIELKFSPDVALNFSVLGMDPNIGPPPGWTPIRGGPMPKTLFNDDGRSTNSLIIGPIELKFSPDVPLNYSVKGMDPSIGPPPGWTPIRGAECEKPYLTMTLLPTAVQFKRLSCRKAL